MGTLRFEYDEDKFVQAASYLTRQCPEMTKMKLFKLLFFADMKHISTYGRPICGGHYVAMQFGPVHSEGYSMMNNHKSQLHLYLRILGKDISLKDKPADVDALSKSDLMCLDDVIGQYKDHHAEYLSELSHEVAAWKDTARNGDILYEHLLECDEDLKEIVRDDQEIRDFVADLKLNEESNCT